MLCIGRIVRTHSGMYSTKFHCMVLEMCGSTMFYMFGNTAIAAESKSTVYTHYQSRKHQCKLYMTSCNDSPTLLSYESSTAMGLVASPFQIRKLHGTPEYIPKQPQQNPSVPKTQGRAQSNVPVTSTTSAKVHLNPNCQNTPQSQISF